MSSTRQQQTMNLQFIRQNLCTTLQGNIHLMQDVNTNQILIIKQTSKKLIELGISHKGDKIQENFLEEKRILSYLSQQKDINNHGICTIYNNYEWEDEHSYYFAMKYCKCDLFDFITKQWTYYATNPTMKQIMKHHATNNIPYKPWIDVIQNIFRQLIRSVNYLHSKGIAHLDLSLENTMLDNTAGIDTQIIDFGVALDISQNNNSWKTCKRVGKISYMSPEVAAKGVVYDARAADIWSLGVILFMMLTGSAPYKIPQIAQNKDDISGDWTLTLMLSGYIEEILKQQQKTWMVNEDALDLMQRIFRLEKNRITMDELLSHPFVGLNNKETSKLNVNVNRININQISV